MASYSVFMYDYFYENGTDLYPHLNMSKDEATKFMFESYPDSKFELIQVEEYITKPNPNKASFTKEVKKDEYYVGYNIDLVDGAFLKIEKKRKRD